MLSLNVSTSVHGRGRGSPGTPARFGADVTTKLWWQPSGHGPARTQASCTSSGVSHVEAQINCHLYGVYIDTHMNHLADESRIHVLSFSVKGAISRQPANPTSPELLSLLLNPQADWIMVPAVQHYF